MFSGSVLSIDGIEGQGDAEFREQPGTNLCRDAALSGGENHAQFAIKRQPGPKAATL